MKILNIEDPESQKRNILDLTKLMCQVSHVTPTATATDLTPSSSPTLHSWLVCRDPKAQKNVKTRIVLKRQKIKMSRGMLFNQKSQTHAAWAQMTIMCDGTD